MSSHILFATSGQSPTYTNISQISDPPAKSAISSQLSEHVIGTTDINQTDINGSHLSISEQR